MKFKKLLSLLAVSALATGLLAGCGGEEKAGEEKATDSNVIKVGVFLPLTGDNAAGGELELRGIKLANQLHPEVLGKKVELVVADNKSDKAEAASVAARLIEKDAQSSVLMVLPFLWLLAILLKKIKFRPLAPAAPTRR